MSPTTNRNYRRRGDGLARSILKRCNCFSYRSNRMGGIQMNPSLDNSASMLPRPLRPEEIREQQQAFLDAIYPLTQMKVRIYSLFMPTLIMDSQGNLVSSAYPDDCQELIKQIDAKIQQVADSWLRP